MTLHTVPQDARSSQPIATGLPAHGPAPHTQLPEAVLRELDTTAVQGLAAEESRKRLQHYGPNELATAPPESLWRKFLRQFSDLVVWLLIVAAGVSMALREW